MFCPDFSLTRRDVFFSLRVAACCNSAGSDSDSPMVWGFPSAWTPWTSMDQYQIGYYPYINECVERCFSRLRGFLMFFGAQQSILRGQHGAAINWISPACIREVGSSRGPNLGCQVECQVECHCKRFCCQAGVFLFAVKDFP